MERRTKPLNIPQSLTPGQVAEALRSVRASRAWTGTKLALEFMVLTAARRREVCKAVWDEIDLEASLWTIPAGHRVPRRSHRVPLSPAAMSVLTKASGLASAGSLVFPARTGKELRSYALTNLLKDSSVGAPPHEFRNSFLNWCVEMDVDRRVTGCCAGSRGGGRIGGRVPPFGQAGAAQGGDGRVGGVRYC